ncbi:hypothetical protein [Roseateles sp.]|uniref:hypothetical protein n=1 Tax=Roseateles sp. TaxID=1971397 RepID=UPI00394E19AC
MDRDTACWTGRLTPVAPPSAAAGPEQSTPPPDERKAFATLQAQAALRGFRLERIGPDDGGPSFLMSSWGYTAELLSLNEVEGFLDGEEASGGERELSAARGAARAHPTVRSQPYRSPLATAVCTCGSALLANCLACARWRRHAATVRARLVAWRS